MTNDFIQSLLEIIQSETTLKEKREFEAAQKLYTNWLNDVLQKKGDVIPTLSDPENELLKQNIALAFNNRGQLKYLAVDFDGAIEDYDKALEYNSSLPSGYYNRGTIFYRMGYFNKAVEDITLASQLKPDCEEFKIALERCKNDAKV